MKISDIHSINLNIRNIINVDYDIINSCDESCCDSICRCWKIVDAKIQDDYIKINKITKALQIVLISTTRHKKPHNRAGKMYKTSDMENYCLDRLFTLYKLYDGNNYDIGILYGYYGEEIGEVVPKNFTSICDDIKTILCFDNDIDKIKFVLNKEYGHLLDIINSCTTATIKHIDATELYKNDDYFSRIKKSDCDFELNSGAPIGVVYEKNNSYRLIDGYHRTVLACGGNYPYVVVS